VWVGGTKNSMQITFCRELKIGVRECHGNGHALWHIPNLINGMIGRLGCIFERRYLDEFWSHGTNFLTQ